MDQSDMVRTAHPTVWLLGDVKRRVRHAHQSAGMNLSNLYSCTFLNWVILAMIGCNRRRMVLRLRCNTLAGFIVWI